MVACGDGSVPGADNLRVKETVQSDERPAIVFLGTSLTAGLGVEKEEAYPAVIEDTVETLGFDVRVVNAGVSGETSTGGLQRIGWVLQTPVAVMVIELGANDGLRGLSTDLMASNIQAIIDSTLAKYPDASIVLVGMQAPPNMGREYTDAFASVFPELAEVNGALLVPFLLEDVGGVAELNQGDQIHPTAEGHRILARNVWRVLGPHLNERFSLGVIN